MSRRRRLLRHLGILLIVVLVLENIPGRYTIEKAQDEFEPDSWEGTLLKAVASARLGARLTFEEETRHRISRNAELIVPAGTSLAVKTTMQPFMEDGEVVARPDTAWLRSDKPLTFIYRGVTVARANVLRMNADPDDPRIQAVGRYPVLTALLTAHRYHRQKKIKRAYRPPTTATIDFAADIRPDHPVSILKEHQVVTGSDPGTLRLTRARYDRGAWTGGDLELTATLSDPEPWLNDMLSTLIPDRFELGSMFQVNLTRIHHIRFSSNQVDLHVDGRLTSANSERVENVVHPSFTADLAVAFDLPQDVRLLEGSARVYLKNIRTIDFNNSNPLFDNTVRAIARNYRDDAEARIDFAEELEELNRFPADIHIDLLQLKGTEEGTPVLQLKATIGTPPGPEPDLPRN